MASYLITIGIKRRWWSSSICFVNLRRSILNSTRSLSNPSTPFSNRLKSFSRLSIDDTSFKSSFSRKTSWLYWIQILCLVRCVKIALNFRHMTVQIIVRMRKHVLKVVSVMPFYKTKGTYLLKTFSNFKYPDSWCKEPQGGPLLLLHTFYLEKSLVKH